MGGGEDIAMSSTFLVKHNNFPSFVYKIEIRLLKAQEVSFCLAERKHSACNYNFAEVCFFPPKSWLINLLELYFKELDGLVDNVLEYILL